MAVNFRALTMDCSRLSQRFAELRKEFGRAESKMAYLCLAPAMLTILVWLVYPTLAAIYYSFTRYDPLSTPEWIGLQNYVRLLDHRTFLISVTNTLKYTAAIIPGSMASGLLFAILVNQKIPLRGLFRTAFYAPYVVSLVAIAMIFQWIFHPDFGFANALLDNLSLPRQRWLGDPQQALPTVTMMSIWRDAGYSMIIYLAGLQSIPDTLYEAAMIDGANRWQRFLFVTLPLLAPFTFFLFVMGIVRSLQVFTQVLILTQGGPMNATTSVVHQMWLTAFAYQKMGLASAMAILLMLAILLVTIVNLKFLSPESVY